MPIVTAYQCPRTDKLFTSKHAYLRHLKSLAERNLAVRNREKKKRKDEQWWEDNFYNKVQSAAQLEAALIHHVVYIVNRALTMNWCGEGAAKVIKENQLSLEFTKFQVDSKNVCNSHNSPIGGVTNFMQIDSLPKSYAGWSCRWEWLTHLSKAARLQTTCSGGLIFENTRIHTGTGGGGSFRVSDSPRRITQAFGYHVELFESDWPAMTAAYEKARVWSRLSGQSDLNAVVNEMYPASEYFANCSVQKRRNV